MANAIPRYTLVGVNTSDSGTAMAPTFTTAAGDYTGATATHNKIVFTADSTNGSRLAGVKFTAKGTNVATVARIYVNNGSDPTNAANNSLVGMISLPATTASNTVAEATGAYYFEGGYIDLDPAFTILVGLSANVSAGWVATPIQGADF